MRESGPATVVTGANAGLGRAIAEAMVARGHHTVLACRDPRRAAQAVDDIRRATGSHEVAAVQLDLADLSSVARCADEILDQFTGIDVLVNNAGGMFSIRSETPQGFERAFCVNYLGHYLLTRLLLDSLRANAPSRIVNVTSLGHRFVRDLQWDDLQLERRYSPNQAYGQSKLAQILFTRELARRLKGSGVVVNAVHPGSVRTRLARDGDATGYVYALTRIINITVGVSPQRAARSSVRLATSPPQDDGGGYWVRNAKHQPSQAARQDSAATRLWTISEELITQSGIDLPPSD